VTGVQTCALPICEITKAITLKGISVTKGAKAAIEAAGGKIEA